MPPENTFGQHLLLQLLVQKVFFDWIAFFRFSCVFGFFANVFFCAFKTCLFLSHFPFLEYKQKEPTTVADILPLDETHIIWNGCALPSRLVSMAIISLVHRHQGCVIVSCYICSGVQCVGLRYNMSPVASGEYDGSQEEN